MTYCTTAELTALTGSTLATATLTAIIEDGDRRIDAYLAPFGVGAAASGACKSASLALAQAGLLNYSLQHGDRADSLNTGDTTEAVRIAEHIARYEKAAFAALDQYVAATASASVRRHYVKKVNG